MKLENVIKLEYYKLFSVKSWLLLYNYVLPHSLYITYEFEGKEICKHIGYPNFRDINRMCLDVGIELKINV